MRAYLKAIARRGSGEDGQALAEYSLVLAFIALACIIALGALGLAIGVPLNELISEAGWASSSS
jgi:Flp pilus assembly pilin Flp